MPLLLFVGDLTPMERQHNSSSTAAQRQRTASNDDLTPQPPLPADASVRPFKDGSPGLALFNQDMPPA